MTRQKENNAITHLALMRVAPADLRPKLACPHASLITLCILTIFLYVNNCVAQNVRPLSKKDKQQIMKNIANSEDWDRLNQLRMMQSNFPSPSIEQQINEIYEQYRFTLIGFEVQKEEQAWQMEQQQKQLRQQMGINAPPTQADIDEAMKNQLNGKPPALTEDQKQRKEVADILNEINSESNNTRFDMSYYKSFDFLNKSKSFTDAFNSLNNMLTGKTPLSISKSYLTIENAYGNTYLTEKEYNNLINQSAKFIRQWLIKNGLNPAKNEDLHYGIQKFMRDTLTISIKQPENKLPKTITHYPFSYDYVDFKAEKDYRNYFITKCLATGTGQCNSLPATYLAIAEKLGAKTYLSFAP